VIEQQPHAANRPQVFVHGDPDIEVEGEGVGEPFEVCHFGGHWFDDTIDLPRAIASVVGNPALPVRRFPWWAVVAASPFVDLAREMAAMRYLWREPLRLDNKKLVTFIGEEPHTPLDAPHPLARLDARLATSPRRGDEKGRDIDRTGPCFMGRISKGFQRVAADAPPLPGSGEVGSRRTKSWLVRVRGSRLNDAVAAAHFARPRAPS